MVIALPTRAKLEFSVQLGGGGEKKKDKEYYPV